MNQSIGNDRALQQFIVPFALNITEFDVNH